MRGYQLARQWRLIQRLARSKYGVGLDELASDLECTRRTVYRDLDALMYAGFPVTSDKRDGRVYYRLLEEFELGDAPFTPDELLALAFGEDVLKSLEGTVFHDSIQSAIAKIRASLGPELAAFLARFGEAFRVLPGPHKRYADVRDVIRTLNEAALDRRTVRMSYTTARTGETAERDLDPYRVWYRSGALYVIGHDHKSGELRTFAVDRIQAPSLTDATFEIPDDLRLRGTRGRQLRRRRRGARAGGGSDSRRAVRSTSRNTSGTRASRSRRPTTAPSNSPSTSERATNCASGCSPSVPTPRCSSPSTCGTKSRPNSNGHASSTTERSGRPALRSAARCRTPCRRIGSRGLV